jgi:hypothetical protein
MEVVWASAQGLGDLSYGEIFGCYVANLARDWALSLHRGSRLGIRPRSRRPQLQRRSRQNAAGRNRKSAARSPRSSQLLLAALEPSNPHGVECCTLIASDCLRRSRRRVRFALSNCFEHPKDRSSLRGVKSNSESWGGVIAAALRSAPARRSFESKQGGAALLNPPASSRRTPKCAFSAC